MDTSFDFSLQILFKLDAEKDSEHVNKMSSLCCVINICD